jgi:hypothetical protein
MVWEDAWLSEAEAFCKKSGERLGHYVSMRLPPCPAAVLEEVCVHVRGWYAAHQIERDPAATMTECLGALFGNIYGHGTHPGDACLVPATDGLTEECIAAMDAAEEWFQAHGQTVGAV